MAEVKRSLGEEFDVPWPRDIDMGHSPLGEIPSQTSHVGIRWITNKAGWIAYLGVSTNLKLLVETRADSEFGELRSLDGFRPGQGIWWFVGTPMTRPLAICDVGFSKPTGIDMVCLKPWDTQHNWVHNLYRCPCSFSRKKAKHPLLIIIMFAMFTLYCLSFMILLLLLAIIVVIIDNDYWCLSLFITTINTITTILLLVLAIIANDSIINNYRCYGY